ncbi:MAG TPA: malic enzyme-like NAD(P)-binding protein [Candidatus Bilamarchaeaceae archaeon]|nr:malic enzyme-like NAD(P)-binding protein [Candidatus Bilamarchaeaceae archaeon]
MEEEAIELHKKLKGKIGIEQRIQMKNVKDLSLLYTPGVAHPCRRIAVHPEEVYDLTMKHNTVAIVSDGSRILGLGNIGAEAGLPLLEGKALIMKQFANIDAFPIALRTQDKNKIVEIVKNIEPVFGAINLEDIESPKVFEIEEELEKELPIAVFHDDQHGTAVVVLAGLLNALQLVGKRFKNIKMGLVGAGGAGYGVANLLHAAGVKDLVVFDRAGPLGKHRKDLPPYKKRLAGLTNPDGFSRPLSDFKDADVIVSLASPGALPHATIENMAKDKIVFALANPIPEISLEEAKKLRVKIFGTGRSDYPNQINNAIGFPGILRAILDYRIPRLTDKIKIAAARGIAKTLPPSKLTPEKTVPDVFDKTIVPNICKEVKKALD